MRRDSAAGGAPGTPAHGCPLSDSPRLDPQEYSPLSNPYAERPVRRTSAGIAVRHSGSDLPTPGPFTPAASPPAATPEHTPPRQPAGSVSASLSCGGSNYMGETGTPVESLRDWQPAELDFGSGTKVWAAPNTPPPRSLCPAGLLATVCPTPPLA
jgi:hypothetical protein